MNTLFELLTVAYALGVAACLLTAIGCGIREAIYKGGR